MSTWRHRRRRALNGQALAACLHGSYASANLRPWRYLPDSCTLAQHGSYPVAPKADSRQTWRLISARAIIFRETARFPADLRVARCLCKYRQQCCRDRLRRSFARLVVATREIGTETAPGCIRLDDPDDCESVVDALAVAHGSRLAIGRASRAT